MANVYSSVLKYSILPGFIPRLRELSHISLSTLAVLIAYIYSSVRLLPRYHPYLVPENRGRFRIRDVIGAAANNLEFKWRNIDQIIVFTLILLSFIIFILQLVLLVLAFMGMQVAVAGNLALNTTDMFAVNSQYGHGFALPQATQNMLTNRGAVINGVGSQDLAFILLDRVFGVHNIFNSCIETSGEFCHNFNFSTGVADRIAGTQFAVYPSRFHAALHTLLKYYSYGMFAVGTIIILYHVIVIVSEASVTGTPFGQRVNKAWAPVRLLFFFALLLPIGGYQGAITVGTLNINGNQDTNNYGFNGAQLITLWTAKFGSNFATNGWGYFNDVLANRVVEQGELLVTPKVPTIHNMVQFVVLARMCEVMEEVNLPPDANLDIEPVMVGSDESSASASDFQTYASVFVNANILSAGLRIAIGYDLVPPAAPQVLDDSVFNRFYIEDAKKYGNSLRRTTNRQIYNIKPLCGELHIPVSAASRVAGVQPAAVYFDLFRHMWNESGPTRATAPTNPPSIRQYVNCEFERRYAHRPRCSQRINEDFFKDLVAYYEGLSVDLVHQQVQRIQNVTAGAWTIDPSIRLYGWAGAALWYRQVADINARFIDGVNASPAVKRFPLLMEQVAAKQKAYSDTVSVSGIFSPNLPNGDMIEFDRPTLDPRMASIYHMLYTVSTMEGTIGTNPDVYHPKVEKSDFVRSAIGLLFGASGVYDMLNNQSANPLAQLSALGKSMLNAAIRNIALDVGGSLALANVSEELNGLFPGASGAIKVVTDTMGSFGRMTLVMSFILYYLLPALPFIYMFFALCGWVKCIFEAIVAMPLWALAHLRIDGEGLPGRDAATGYYLLLEIFLRPILTIVGLIGSVILFSSMVLVFNDLFHVFLVNAAGANITDATNSGFIGSIRGEIDEFFYTLVYVMIVYMMGMSSFKLIDQVPHQILRWMGVSAQTFQEQSGDIGENLAGTVYSKGSIFTNNLSGGQLAALGQ